MSVGPAMLLGRRAVLAAVAGAFASAGLVAARRADVRLSLTVSGAAVRVPPERRSALALAALRAVPDVTCHRARAVVPSPAGRWSAIVVEGEGMSGSGRPVHLVQWLWWRGDGRTVRLLLVAGAESATSAGVRIAAAPATV